MSSGSGGGSTSTTTSGPPPQFLQAYTDTVNRATNVANQPLQQYTGNVVAGLSPDQQAGIAGIQNAQGVANPFINAAAQQIGASTTPLQPTVQPYANDAMAHFTAAPEVATLGFNAAVPLFGQAGQGINFNQLNDADIQRYQNPYTTDVINATQAQFNNQNAIQQAGVTGNAISNGAFGGDRSAVAAGITAGQQQMAQAPVIAGLRNQGYAQALAAAQQQQQAGLGAQQATIQAKLAAGQGLSGAGSQLANAYQNAGQGITGVGGQILGANQAQDWLASQAGFGYSNLGNQALQTQLTGANALLGAGGLEQQIAQENLNVPYQQFLQQQGYPFQTTSFLANIAEGLGGASGGNSSTTQPGPNVGSQLVGAGIAGVGLANQLGAFSGSSGGGGWGGGSGFVDSGSWDTGFAGGGAVPGFATGGMVPMGDLPPDLSISYIPAGGGSAGSGKGSFNLLNPGMQNVSQTQSGGGGGGGGGAGALKGAASGAALGSAFGPIGTGIGAIAGGLFGGLFKDGGGVPELADGGAGPGITAFPAHRTRMPGTRNVNDNLLHTPSVPKLAAGGIAIPQMAGGIMPNAGPGGNGILIPQMGGHTMPGPGIQAVTDYIDAAKAPPPPPRIIPNLAASIVPPPLSPSVPFGGIGNGVIDQSFVGGGGGGNSEGGGSNGSEGGAGGGGPNGGAGEGMGGGANSETSSAGGSAGDPGGADMGGGAGGSDTGGGGPGGESGGGNDGGGEWKGGPIKRDDGGYLPNDTARRQTGLYPLFGDTFDRPAASSPNDLTPEEARALQIPEATLPGITSGSRPNAPQTPVWAPHAPDISMPMPGQVSPADLKATARAAMNPVARGPMDRHDVPPQPAGPMDRDSAAMTAPPGSGIAINPITPANSSENPEDWRAPVPPPGGTGGPPPIAAPNTTAPAGGITAPVQPATYRGPSVPQGQVAEGPPAPPEAAPSGPTPAGITGNDMPPPQRHPAEPKHDNNWGETLVNVGLGIMGGQSPFAMTNIGRGGLEGLKLSENQRLRRAQQEDTAAFRQATSDNRRYGIDTRADTASNSAATRLQIATMLNDRVNFWRDKGFNELTANQKATQELRAAGLDLATSKAAITSDQRQQTIDQGGERIALARQAAQMRDKFKAAAQGQAEINAANRATQAEMARAVQLSVGLGITLPKALLQVQAGTATQQPPRLPGAASPAPAAAAQASPTPVEGKIYTQGGRQYRFTNGQMVPL